MIIRPNAGFIIPTPRFVDVGMPKASVGAAGRYQLIKYERGIEIERTPWFDNIILDSGLNKWGTAASISGAAIGTGTATPASTDTGLQTESHYTTTTGTGSGSSALGSSPYNNTVTYVYRTTLGSLNGNYTEVGVGWATGQMFSRALILDGGGSPTTIAVTSAQQLDIVYQLSIYPPLTDIGPTTITISGVDYDVTGRAANVNSLSSLTGWTPSVWASRAISAQGGCNVYPGTIGAITGIPSGTAAGGTSALVGSYSNNSLQRSATASYGLTDGNASGGIKSTMMSWGAPTSTAMASFQYEFDPVIPKNGTKTLVLNYSITWARR